MSKQDTGMLVMPSLVPQGIDAVFSVAFTTSRPRWSAE
jgi:hypothetical protein